MPVCRQDEYRQLLTDHGFKVCEDAAGRSGLCRAYGVVGAEVLKIDWMELINLCSSLFCSDL